MNKESTNFAKEKFKVLVVGASGGIGLAMTKFLLSDENVERVYATFRRLPAPAELTMLANETPDRLHLHQLDLIDEDSVGAAAQALSLDADVIDMIINTAGLLHSEHQMPERRLQEVQPEALIANFQVNAVGALLVAKHFSTFLPRKERAVLATLSARVGSISDNHLGGWYSYRASKAAQNMLTRSLSIELARSHRQLICVALHPGTVDTELSEPFQKNVSAEKLFTPHRAAQQLLQVLHRLTPEDNGQFFAWDGQSIDW